MVNRKSEIQARKDRILAMAIDRYIKTVLPVSSQSIAQEYPDEVSSATIRNILAELEEEGYLTHPHTSAGRVPTEKGYRYYVDNLMNEIQLLEAEKKRIKSEYYKKSLELDNLLDKTSEVVSQVTHYTSLITVDGWDNKLFCRGTGYVVQYPDQSDIKKIQNILTALDEKERILEILNQDLRQKIGIFIGHEIAWSQIDSCSLVVSRYRTKEGSTGRIAVLGPTRMNYIHVVSTLDYLSQLMEEVS